jgi:hypothetical protein
MTLTLDQPQLRHSITGGVLEERLALFFLLLLLRATLGSHGLQGCSAGPSLPSSEASSTEPQGTAA